MASDADYRMKNVMLMGRTASGDKKIVRVDDDGKLVTSGPLVLKGTWNANTNTPTLVDGTGSTGWFYVVSVAGTQDLGSGNITFAVGDWALYNGTIWQKADHSDAVSSVDGEIGAVDGRYTQAIFFGKGGDNTKDGKSYITRKLTLAAAKTAASALTPASGNQIVLVCEDAGTYTENYTNVVFVHVHAPAAILVGTITIAENCQISFGDVQGNITVNTGKILYCNILNHSSGTNTLTGTAKVRGQIGDEIYIKKVNFIA